MATTVYDRLPHYRGETFSYLVTIEVDDVPINTDDYEFEVELIPESKLDETSVAATENDGEVEISATEDETREWDRTQVIRLFSVTSTARHLEAEIMVYVR